MCQVANVSAGRSARVIQGGKKRRRRHKLQQRACGAHSLCRDRNKCKLQYVPVSKIAKEFRKTPIDSIDKKCTMNRRNKGTLSPPRERTDAFCMLRLFPASRVSQ